ncbi:MAG TPA: hypothetical protein VF842_09150 [Flavobacterium sp.]
MEEFMLYIRNKKDAKKTVTAEKHLTFIKECETYIGILKSENKLIAAQPLIREGIIIKKSNHHWIEKDIATDEEIQVGYYHILAKDIHEAIKIAKDNPEFKYVESATIEVRPIKTTENETGFVYPKEK